MNLFDVKYALEHITILVDTREQNTERSRKRLAEFGFPYERKKLDFGDYSVRCELEDGTEVDLSSSVAVERKMNLDELCSCYCRERKRFEREFERAKDNGAKIYLLVENGSWENVYGGKYRSKMSASALKASILAWLARYDCQIVFCKAETTGRMIGDILYRELKERLEGMIDG